MLKLGMSTGRTAWSVGAPHEMEISRRSSYCYKQVPASMRMIGEVVELLSEARVNSERWDDYEPTSLIRRNGYAKVVRLLLEARENIDVGDSKEYESARLIWAAINGHAEVVKLLLTVQAKVEGKDNRDTNWTPPM